MSDEKRFKKHINAPLLQVRNLVGDALFTVRTLLTNALTTNPTMQAYGDEPEWWMARKARLAVFLSIADPSKIVF